MANDKYPVRRDSTDLLSHPDNGLMESQRQQDVSDRLGAAGGGPYAVASTDYGNSWENLHRDGTGSLAEFYVPFNTFYQESAASGYTFGDIPVIGWDARDYRLIVPSAGWYQFSFTGYVRLVYPGWTYNHKQVDVRIGTRDPSIHSNPVSITHGWAMTYTLSGAADADDFYANVSAACWLPAGGDLKVQLVVYATDVTGVQINRNNGSNLSVKAV